MGSCKSCVWLWQWLLKVETATMLTTIDLINPSFLFRVVFWGVIRMDWTLLDSFTSNFSLLDSFYWGLRCIEYWQFILNSNYVGSIIKWNIVIIDQVWLCNLWFFFFFLVFFFFGCSDRDSKRIWSITKPCFGWSRRVFER